MKQTLCYADDILVYRLGKARDMTVKKLLEDSDQAKCSISGAMANLAKQLWNYDMVLTQ